MLLYEFYKTLDCDTSWLAHDERSEESSNRTVRLIKKDCSVIYNFFYVGRINLIKTRKSNYEII
jgi:hypothetical protein